MPTLSVVSHSLQTTRSASLITKHDSEACIVFIRNVACTTYFPHVPPYPACVANEAVMPTIPSSVPLPFTCSPLQELSAHQAWRYESQLCTKSALPCIELRTHSPREPGDPLSRNCEKFLEIAELGRQLEHVQVAERGDSGRFFGI